MTWKTSLDKRTGGLWAAFTWQLRRGLPLGAMYGALFLLFGFWKGYPWHSSNMIFLNGLAVVFSFLLPGWMFGCCFSRSQADFVHALPVKRGAFFLGSLGAGLCYLWLPVFPCLVAREALHILCGQAFYPAAPVMLVMSLCSLAFFCLVAVCCGSYGEYVAVSVLLTIAGPLLLYQAGQVLLATVPAAEYVPLPLFYIEQMGSPPVSLFFSFQLQHQQGMTQRLPLVWSLLLAPLLVWLGWRRYCRRPSEEAGSFFRCEGMMLFLRTELSLLAAFWVGFWACCVAWDYRWGDAGVPGVLGFMALALAAAWLVTEWIGYRSLKKLFHHWLALAIPLALTVGALAAFSTGLGIDTASPDFTGLAGAQASSYRYSQATTLYYETNLGMPNNHYGILAPGVTSEEGIAKVRTLHEKLLEIERASQYPYLPGRYAYDTGYNMSYTYFGKKGGRYTSFYPGSFRITPEVEALLKEYQALEEELFTSEEYVESLFLLNALDGLGYVQKWDGSDPELSFSRVSVEPGPGDLAAEDFPKGFLQQLEEALRQDFSSGCHSTYPGMKAAGKDGYLLCYQAGASFLAKGGILGTDMATASHYQFGPAAGMQLTLASEHYDGSFNTGFRITPEMPATYALLDRVYKSTRT